MKIWEDEAGRLNFEAITKRSGRVDQSGQVYTREALAGAVKAFEETHHPTFGGLYDAKCSGFEYQPEETFEIRGMRLDADSNLVISGRTLGSPAGAALADHLRSLIGADLAPSLGAAGFGNLSMPPGPEVVESFTVSRVTISSGPRLISTSMEEKHDR